MSFLNTAHTSRPRDTATPGRMRQVAVRRPRERSARSPTSIERTRSSSPRVRLRAARPSNGPGRSWRTLRSSCDESSAGGFALGLKLGATRSDRSVLGWEVRRNTPDVALLAVGSRPPAAGRAALRAPPGHAARRDLRSAAEPDRTRDVGRGRAPTSTGRAVRPRAGRPRLAPSGPEDRAPRSGSTPSEDMSPTPRRRRDDRPRPVARRVRHRRRRRR